MKIVVDFLLEYWVWFVVVIVILLITVVGFLVDTKKKKKLRDSVNNNNNEHVDNGMNMNNMNMMGNISTIHSYNRKNVKEEDVPAYGKTVGLGTVIIGLSLILAFIWEGFKAEIGLILGLGFILYGQIKYNKGIF